MITLPLSNEIEAEYDLGSVLLDFFPTDNIKSMVAEWAASLGQPANERIFSSLCDFISGHSSRMFQLPSIDYFVGTDKFMAALNKRGHHRHQFETFLLGLNLLKCIKPVLTEDNFSSFGTNNWNDIVNSWFTTAIGHDYGIPVQDASKLLKKFAELFGDFGFTKLKDSILKVINDKIVLTAESLCENVNDKDEKTDLSEFIDEALKLSIDTNVDKKEEIFTWLKCKLLQQNTSTEVMDNGPSITIDHGYASALCFVNSNIQLLFTKSSSVSRPSVRNNLLLNQARKIAGAMALHGIKSNNENNSYLSKLICSRENPYAYLLFMADNIQDWGRVLFKSENYSDYRLTKIEHSENGLLIEITALHDNWSQTTIENTEKHLDEVRMLLSKPQGFNSNKYLTIKYVGMPSRTSEYAITREL